jgi:hypothetical protein
MMLGLGKYEEVDEEMFGFLVMGFGWGMLFIHVK